MPGIVLGLIADYSALAEERAELPDAERSLAQTVGGLVDSALDQAIAVAWSIATGASTRSLNPAIIDPRLQRLAPVYQQYDNIIVVDAQGTSVGEMRAYPPGVARVNLSTEPYVRTALDQNQPAVGPINYGSRTGRPYAPVAVPVRDLSGHVVGAVVVALSLGYYHMRLGTIPLAQGQRILITDSIGRLAYDSMQSGPPSTLVDLGSVPLVHAALVNGSATQDSGPFGNVSGSWLGVAEATPRYHWVVAVIEPVGAATASLTRAILVDLASLIVAVTLSFVGSYYLTQRILTPVRTLERAAREWTAGNLDERVSIRTQDEFATLGATFNRMAATLSDTLQRLRDADERLTVERNQLRAILETSPAGIVVVDDSEIVRLVNPAARSLLGDGVSLDQPFRAGAIVDRVFHPDGTRYRVEDLPIIRSLKDGVAIAGAEILVRRPNGWEVHLLTNCAPIRGENGTIVGVAAVFFDISPFAEEERLRTEFVVSAAHEFRNPLTVIKGYAEVAMRDPSVQGTGVYRELTRILDAANQVSRLADELLRAAELHLPPLILRTEVLDLDVLVRDTVERFREAEAGRDYQLNVNVRPAKVEGDPVLLSEAITNLLRQAEAAMPNGGAIDVEVSAWDGIATVAVTDHGPVVPPERIPSLFLPFAISAQTPASTVTPRPTLLLYLTKRIVEESGGWIRAESSPAGTKILITLPRYPSQRLPRSRPTSDQAMGTPPESAGAPNSSPPAETHATRGGSS